MDAIIKSLGFNVQIFLIQVVVFIVLVLVMKFLFWDPYLTHLKQRDQNIEDTHKTVDDLQREMETLRADYQARIGIIEAEARTHIQTAVKEAQTERERLIAEARAHSDETIRQAVADMERERAEAFHTLRERMVGLALSAVGKALGTSADPIVLRRVVEDNIARN